MPGLTEKLFNKLSEENQNIEVNDELLKQLNDNSKEYDDLKSQDDPTERTKRLKTLVLKLYKEHSLKDVEFFKYLAWSGQSHLCKLIGYGDKQLDKWVKEKQEQSEQAKRKNQGPDITRGAYFGDVAETDKGRHGDEMVIDGPICPPHQVATVTPPQQSPKMPSSQQSPVITPSQQPGPTTHIIYSEEDSDDVHLLSDFLNSCGVPCDIDQYHTQENILNWGVWNQQKIENNADLSVGGFVLLVCSHRMYEQLSQPNKSSRIQMKPGHIDSLTLNSLITGPSTTHCIIPVCLEGIEMKNIPKCLTERSRYSLSLSKLKQFDSNMDRNLILSAPGLESLQDLVYKLRGIPEAERPS